MKNRRAELQEALEKNASREVTPVTPDRPTTRGRSTPTKSGTLPETAEDSSEQPSEGEEEGEHGVKDGLDHRPIPSPLRAIPREGWGNGDEEFSDAIGEDADGDGEVTPTEVEDAYVPCMEDFYGPLTTTTSPENDSGEEEARVYIDNQHFCDAFWVFKNLSWIRFFRPRFLTHFPQTLS